MAIETFPYLLSSKYSYFSHSSSRYIKVLVEAKVVSQDVATNSAQVVFRARITLDAININGNYMQVSCSSATVDGQTVSVSEQAYNRRVELRSGQGGYDAILTGGVLWETKPVTITYNANRTKTVSVKVAFGASAYSVKEVYNPGGWYEEQSTLLGSTSGTITTSWSLPELPTYAVITGVGSAMTDSENVVRVISYVVPSGTTNIQIGALFSNGTVAIPFVDQPSESGEYIFGFANVDEATKKQIWANTIDKGLSSTQITFHIKSYDPIANKQYDKPAPHATLLTITDYKPTLEPDIWDTNDITRNLTNDEHVLIKYFSDVRYDAGAYAHKGATLSQIQVTNGNNISENFADNFVGIINPEFTFRVWDSRGNVTEAITNLSPTNWVDYTKLTCSASTTDMTADGDVGVTISGKYFNSQFGAKGDNNTLRVQCTVVPFRGETKTYTYENVEPVMNGNSYTHSFIIPDLSYTNSYTFTVTVTDKLMVATSDSTVVSPDPIFDWGREDFNFNVPVNVNGEITAESIKINGYTVPTIVEQGTSGNWTYRKWSDGVAECWSIVTLNTAITTAWGSMYVGTTKMSKVNYPTSLFNAKPVETVTAQSPTNAIWVFAESGSTGMNSSTTTGIYNICRPNQVTTSGYYYLSFYVRGRWK